MVNGLLVIMDTKIEIIIYRNENFNPSIYALDFVFFPSIMAEIRIDIMGINSFITFVGKVIK